MKICCSKNRAQKYAQTEKEKNVDDEDDNDDNDDDDDDDDAAALCIRSFVHPFLASAFSRSSLKSGARLVDNVFIGMRIVEAVGEEISE